MSFLATITRAAVLGRILGVTIREYREQQAQRVQPYRGPAPPVIPAPVTAGRWHERKSLRGTTIYYECR
jgi:hypothetical protein